MTLDNKIRIDHGNDFTLVDKKDFYTKLDEVFRKAEHVRSDLEGLTNGVNNTAYFMKLDEMENILSYKSKSEDEKAKLYSKLILSYNSKKNIFDIDYESMHH